MSVSSIFDEYNLPRLLSKTEKPLVPQIQEKLEISLSCQNLRTPDPDIQITSQIKVYLDNGDQRRFVGETEIAKKTSDPKFSGTFSSDYYFEVKQVLLIEVMVIRRQTWELLGQVTTTFGEIVGRMNKAAVFEIRKDNQIFGKLIVQSQKIKGSNMVACFDIEARKLKKVRGWFKKNNPFFRLFRIQEGEDDTLAYESEVLPKEANPHWKPFEVSLIALCENNHSNLVKLAVYCQRKRGDKLIGGHCFTIDQLKSESDRELLLWKSPQKPGKLRGIAQIKDLLIKEKPAFLDYLNGGLQLNIMLAIDFTSSNKAPTNSESLHVLRKSGGLNPYQKVMSSIVDILLYYNHDKKVSLYGFGGKPPGYHQTSHAFPLTGKEDSAGVYGMDGVMEVYKKAVQEVVQSGPTYFEHVMQKAMKIASNAKEQGPHQYIILTILTDGLIHDEERTINCLVQAAQLPMSVIIIGVGDADFKNMEIFNRDDGLYNTAGLRVERKLVQFAPFNRVTNEEELAHRVLKPVPKQLVEYMEMMNISPATKIQVNIENLSPQKTQTGFKTIGSQDELQDSKYHSIENVYNGNGKNSSRAGKGTDSGLVGSESDRI